VKRDDRKLKKKRVLKDEATSAATARLARAGPGGQGPKRPQMETVVEELRTYRKSFVTHTGIELSEKLVRSLCVYVTELFKWNDRAALISRSDESRVVERHVMDSLSVLAFLRGTEQTTLLDIGSGAGFPAIPLKLAAPRLEVTLVESVRKKQLFLRYIIEKLALSHIRVLTGRAEDDPWRSDTPLGFDVVTSRATFSLKDFVAIAGSAVARGGLLIAYKGARYEDELAQAADALTRAGLKLMAVWESPWGPGRLAAFQKIE
jgi:16S rRNA (guanine527-N7)-methyltransferase